MNADHIMNNFRFRPARSNYLGNVVHCRLMDMPSRFSICVYPRVSAAIK